jgi:CO/xanthine dehydrogenase Mo-binding subunit
MPGLKGAGQSGSVARLAAIAKAVEDALSPLGVTIDQVPLTQERIWAKIIQQVRKKKRV